MSELSIERSLSSKRPRTGEYHHDSSAVGAPPHGAGGGTTPGRGGRGVGRGSGRGGGSGRGQGAPPSREFYNKPKGEYNSNSSNNINTGFHGPGSQQYPRDSRGGYHTANGGVWEGRTSGGTGGGYPSARSGVRSGGADAMYDYGGRDEYYNYRQQSAAVGANDSGYYPGWSDDSRYYQSRDYAGRGDYQYSSASYPSSGASSSSSYADNYHHARQHQHGPLLPFSQSGGYNVGGEFRSNSGGGPNGSSHSGHNSRVIGEGYSFGMKRGNRFPPWSSGNARDVEAWRSYSYRPRTAGEFTSNTNAGQSNSSNQFVSSPEGKARMYSFGTAKHFKKGTISGNKRPIGPRSPAGKQQPSGAAQERAATPPPEKKVVTDPEARQIVQMFMSMLDYQTTYHLCQLNLEPQLQNRRLLEDIMDDISPTERIALDKAKSEAAVAAAAAAAAAASATAAAVTDTASAVTAASKASEVAETRPPLPPPPQQQQQPPFPQGVPPLPPQSRSKSSSSLASLDVPQQQHSKMNKSTSGRMGGNSPLVAGDMSVSGMSSGTSTPGGGSGSTMMRHTSSSPRGPFPPRNMSNYSDPELPSTTEKPKGPHSRSSSQNPGDSSSPRPTNNIPLGQPSGSGHGPYSREGASIGPDAHHPPLNRPRADSRERGRIAEGSGAYPIGAIGRYDHDNSYRNVRHYPADQHGYNNDRCGYGGAYNGPGSYDPLPSSYHDDFYDQQWRPHYYDNHSGSSSNGAYHPGHHHSSGPYSAGSGSGSGSGGQGYYPPYRSSNEDSYPPPTGGHGQGRGHPPPAAGRGGGGGDAGRGGVGGGGGGGRGRGLEGYYINDRPSGGRGRGAGRGNNW